MYNFSTAISQQLSTIKAVGISYNSQVFYHSSQRVNRLASCIKWKMSTRSFVKSYIGITDMPLNSIVIMKRACAPTFFSNIRSFTEPSAEKKISFLFPFFWKKVFVLVFKMITIAVQFRLYAHMILATRKG